MLPALRRTLQSFTQRADIIIRQLSYLHSQQHTDIVGLCRELASLPEAEQHQRLAAPGRPMSPLTLQRTAPALVQRRERRPRPPIHSLMLDPGLPDDDTLNELAVQRRLDQAFAINAGSLRSYLQAALGEGRRID